MIGVNGQSISGKSEAQTVIRREPFGKGRSERRLLGDLRRPRQK